MHSENGVRTLLIPLVLACASVGAAAQRIDSLSVVQIDSSVIRTSVNTSGLLERGSGVSFSTALSASLPRLLGSSDLLRYAQYLPWVQSTSDIDSGIRLYGCENSHTFVNIDGIPVYGSQHFLGLFSVFASTHFEKMDILSHAGSGSRLGGSVTMTSKTAVPGRPGGEINVGLMETEASFSTPLGKSTALYLSARRSYLNLLYGSFLKIDGYPLTYNLTDLNFTLASSPGRDDRIEARFYWGRDKIGCSIPDYTLTMNDSWGNILGGVSWNHRFSGARLSQQVYLTSFDNDADIDYSLTATARTSSIRDVGYCAGLSFGNGLETGVRFDWYGTAPQSASMNSYETDLWASRSHDFFAWLRMTATAKVEWFLSDEGRSFYGFSPDLDFTFILPSAGTITLDAALRHQYLFQTGLTSLNMPLESWLPAGRYSDPQSSLGADLKYSLDLSGGRFTLNTGAYFNSLRNQLEYDGQIIDLIKTDDRFGDHLLRGDGYNCGAFLMLHKNSGSLTGWLSYTWSRSRRDFAGRGYCPSAHERPHEFKALCVYHLGRWDFSGTFIWASGLPFTPVKSFYINAGRLISSFGAYNSARLPAYLRLDLSVTCHLSKDRHNGLNLSVYNVTCSDNYTNYRLFYAKTTSEYAYLPITLNLDCLPSISYFHKF